MILIVFRNVFPALFTAGGRTLENEGDGVGLGLLAVGSRGVEGDLRPDLGNPWAACKFAAVGIAPVLLRPFGSAGRAVFGGPSEGLPGRGIVAAMV